MSVEQAPNALPDPAKLFLETPLYEAIEIADTTQAKNYVWRLVWGSVAFDAYCTQCNKHSPFKTASRTYASQDREAAVEIGVFTHNIECHRVKSHKYTYIFFAGDTVLTKIGQWPSLEDISGADLEKYRPLLKKNFAELKRASGLASHGIGIGAFVYLRRIFERLIEQHHSERAEPVAGFSGLRMDEKIGALKSELPPALVRNKAAYSILSKGLHELDEETCRSYFPVVKAAIVQILEQDFQAREAAKAEKALQEEIAKIAGKIANS